MSAVDELEVANMVNYFGHAANPDDIEVWIWPILPRFRRWTPSPLPGMQDEPWAKKCISIWYGPGSNRFGIFPAKRFPELYILVCRPERRTLSSILMRMVWILFAASCPSRWSFASEKL